MQDLSRDIQKIMFDKRGNTPRKLQIKEKLRNLQSEMDKAKHQYVRARGEAKVLIAEYKGE